MTTSTAAASTAVSERAPATRSGHPPCWPSASRSFTRVVARNITRLKSTPASAGIVSPASPAAVPRQNPTPATAPLSKATRSQIMGGP